MKDQGRILLGSLLGGLLYETKGREDKRGAAPRNTEHMVLSLFAQKHVRAYVPHFGVFVVGYQIERKGIFPLKIHMNHKLPLNTKLRSEKGCL